jgi:hypothetical protein
MCADAIKKLPGLHKQGDVTLKRAAVRASEAEDPSVKNLPGKTKPPTLILKRGKNGSTELGPIPRPVPEAKIPKK